MNILGLDPGLATTGVGLIKKQGSKLSLIHYGIISTPATMAFEDRIESIYKQLNQLIDENEINEVAIEELFFNTNSKTAIKVAQARGVMILAAKNHTLPVASLTLHRKSN